MGPRNRFQGMNSASPCSLAGRYDIPLPPRFLAPIEFLKIPALPRIRLKKPAILACWIERQNLDQEDISLSSRRTNWKWKDFLGSGVRSFYTGIREMSCGRSRFQRQQRSVVFFAYFCSICIWNYIFAFRTVPYLDSYVYTSNPDKPFFKASTHACLHP